VPRSIVASVLALSLMGCALFQTRLREGYRPTAPPECSTSVVPPGIDLAYGMIFTAFSAFAFANRSCAREGGCFPVTGGLIFGSLAVSFLASGFYGFHQIDRCRAAWRQFRAATRPLRATGTD
jgi:hypothetical protein